MDRLELFGKSFAVVTYANSVPTSVQFNKKSTFADSLLFNVTYDLSGVDTSKSWDELTSEEQAKVISLRAKTPIITAKDTILRSFALKELNKGKEPDNMLTLQSLNEKLFAANTFDESGALDENSDNTTLKAYNKVVCKMLLTGKRNVYYVSMPVSELTNGKFTTWTPEYSDKPQTDVVAYEIDENNLLNAAMSAVARMFQSLPQTTEGEEQ
jgi:hypothetical protein